MKAIKVISCRACPDNCDCEVVRIKNNFPPPRCPLPDWPSMNRDKAMKIYAKIQGTIGGMAVTSKFQTFLDELRSIGVEIKEEKDEKQNSKKTLK